MTASTTGAAVRSNTRAAADPSPSQTRLGWRVNGIWNGRELRWGVYSGVRLIATLPTRQEAEYVVRALNSDPDVVVLG